MLPTKDVELVALHMDVGGVVDFAAGTLAIDASLHDSHVIGFALSGDMVLRATFGGMPSFLMSIGGFHPGFEPVEDIPDVARLSLGLSTPPILYVNFECYFAVTSNTVQFGSAFELRAQVAGFGIEGSTEFDALVQFSPFLVTTHLGFHVSVTAAGFDLAGVWLEANVLGPNPWYVVGTARFKILGIEEDIRVDERIGAPVPEAQVEEADPMQLVRSALSDEGAWSSVATASPGVVLAAGDPAEDELVAMPDGVVAVSQRAVPLGVSLDKVGDAPLGDYDLFHVEPAEGSLASTGCNAGVVRPRLLLRDRAERAALVALVRAAELGHRVRQRRGSGRAGPGGHARLRADPQRPRTGRGPRRARRCRADRRPARGYRFGAALDGVRRRPGR